MTKDSNPLWRGEGAMGRYVIVSMLWMAFAGVALAFELHTDNTDLFAAVAMGVIMSKLNLIHGDVVHHKDRR